MTSHNLQRHSADLTAIGSTLNQNADILLYGCDVGSSSDGEAFISALAQMTQADIAASNDLTGLRQKAAIGYWKVQTAR
ncbi:MAG: DUF4347 domain-containing protein [Methylobacter sp.]|nr:DUF4347 domain-containing protein [Methylobacter sp.]